MKILLDSHYLVWSLQAPQLMTEREYAIISNTENELYFSAISIMELNIKASKGKLPLAKNLAHFSIETGFIPLPFTWEHAETTSKLPLIHSDPFDRMIAAQAYHENLSLMTRDQILRQYPIQILQS